MSIAPFPHRYVVRLSGDHLAAPPRSPIVAGAPPQFGGNDRVWSPEELLVASVELCLRTTFEAFAKRAALGGIGWHSLATGTLIKAAGGPVFSSIDIEVVLETTAGDEVRALGVLHDAERHCIISRMLNIPVHVHVTTKAVSAAS